MSKKITITYIRNKSEGRKPTFISSVSPYPEEEYYLGKSSWSTTAADWDQRFEVGDVVADPSGSWEPSTAQEYVDQQVATLNTELASEAIARQNGDANLRTQLQSEMNTRADQDANLNALINAGIREGGGVQFDVVPTQNSANGITSGGMYSTLKDSNIGFVDDIPTAGSDNLVKSGGVYEQSYYSLEQLDSVQYLYGYVASSTNPQYAEGYLKITGQDSYNVTPLIELQPGFYIINAETSLNALVLSKYTKNGVFVEAMIVGTGQDVGVERYVSISEVTYVRICSKTTIPIKIEKEEVCSIDDISYYFGKFQRNTGVIKEYSGFILSKLIFLKAGKYNITTKTRSEAAAVNIYNEYGVFVSSVIGNTNTNRYVLNQFEVQTDCYVRICGETYVPKLEAVNPEYQKDFVFFPGYIASANHETIQEGGVNVFTLPADIPSGYYTTKYPTVLDAGQYVIKTGIVSASAIVVAKTDVYGNFVQALVVGNGGTEYVFTITEKTFVKITYKYTIELTKLGTNVDNALCIIKNGWHSGYVSSGGNTGETEGDIIDRPYDETAYFYSDIIHLKAGKTYSAVVCCSPNAIPLSRWNNGSYVEALVLGTGTFNSPQRIEYTPDVDMDVRLTSTSQVDFPCFLENVSPHGNKLAGKIINIIGDSYVLYDSTKPEEQWQYKMAKRNYMRYHCYGSAGNPLVAPNFSGIPVVQRYTSMDNNADYVIVIGGRNDYNAQYPLADFRTGIITLIEGLVAKYINRGTKIAFMTPWRVFRNESDDPQTIKMQSYADIIIEECNKRSVPVFDATKNSNVYMWSSDFRTKFCQNANDVSHLNNDGMEYYLPTAEAFIRTL